VLNSKYLPKTVSSPSQRAASKIVFHAHGSLPFSLRTRFFGLAPGRPPASSNPTAALTDSALLGVRQFQVTEPQILRSTVFFNAYRFHCFLSPLMVFLERCNEVAHLPLSLFGQRVKVIQEELPLHGQPPGIH
jgi:hypothetical protein